MLGGRWVQGRTMHPEQDLFTVVVHDGAHPIVEGLSDFTVFDERYCYLRTNPDITVMCEQVTDDRLHPALETALSPMLRVSGLPVQSPGVGARSAAYLRGYRLRRPTSYGAPKVLSERSCWLPQVGPFCCAVLIRHTVVAWSTGMSMTPWRGASLRGCRRSCAGRLRAEGERADYPAGRRCTGPVTTRGAALVVRGLIRVYLSSPGGRQVTVRYARPGDVLGIAVLVGGPADTERPGGRAVERVPDQRADADRGSAARCPGLLGHRRGAEPAAV